MHVQIINLYKTVFIARVDEKKNRSIKSIVSHEINATPIQRKSAAFIIESVIYIVRCCRPMIIAGR